MTDNEESSRLNRRNVLKMTGAAAVSSVSLTGVASAGGRGGSRRPGGRPFLEPTNEDIVFCGCTSVCVHETPGNCSEVEVVLEGDDTVSLRRGECYSGGNVVGVQDQSDNTGAYDIFVCNPNTACSGNEADDCDQVGTAPQFGAGGCD